MRSHQLRVVPRDNDTPQPTHDAFDILLVDDDERELALAVRLLNRRGWDYRLHVARDGRDALGLLFGGCRSSAAKPLRPALIVLRLDLADVDGLWVLGAIKGTPELAGVPVILLSPRSDAEGSLQCMELGTNMYLLKPTSMRDVLRVVMNAERHWIAADELSRRAA